MKKKVPRRALPRKLVGIGLACWTCKEKQCLGTDSNYPQERHRAARLLRVLGEPHPDRAGGHGSTICCKQVVPQVRHHLGEAAAVCLCIRMYVCGCTHAIIRTSLCQKKNALVPKKA